MTPEKSQTSSESGAKRAVRRYDKGERRHKHVGNSSEPEIQFISGDPKRWIGKCPNTLTAADHTRLLNEAIAGDNGDREIDFPKSLYAVNDGAIYKADSTDRGKSYHGYPYRGKLAKRILENLRVIASAKGCENEFDDWVKRHITVHGS